MTEEMKLYYDYTVSPLGQLFYKTVHQQLGEIANKKILDFGSGFAFTSNYLAKNNEVTAVEYLPEMIEAVNQKHRFTQINGDVSVLKKIEDESFDVIILHLVLEFVDDAKTILDEIIRLLKKDGYISVVRHNANGRIIQSVVQDYNLDETKKLLSGAPSFSSAFGDIKYYGNDTLLELADDKLKIESVWGVRAIASLCSAEMMGRTDWLNNMFDIEWELLKQRSFVENAYFNHLILSKV